MTDPAEPGNVGEDSRGGQGGADHRRSSPPSRWLRGLLLRFAALVLALPLFCFIAGFICLRPGLEFPAQVAYLVLAPLAATVISFRAVPGRWPLRLLGALITGPLVLAALLTAFTTLSLPLHSLGLRTAVRNGVNIDLPAVLAWSEIALARNERGELRRVETAGVIDGIYYNGGEVHPDEIAPGVMSGMLERRGPHPSVSVESDECLVFRWRVHGVQVCPHAPPDERVSTTTS